MYEDRDILAIRGRTLRVNCDVADIRTGAVLGKEILSRELEDLEAPLPSAQSLQIIVGINYPEAIDKQKNLELRVTDVEFSAYYELSQLSKGIVASKR